MEDRASPGLRQCGRIQAGQSSAGKRLGAYRNSQPTGSAWRYVQPDSGLGQQHRRDTLTHSPDIDAVSFTGSLEVGRRVAGATAANLVKCQLEMGSKNALIVAADADLDLAVDAAFAGAYSGTGQKCTASSRA